LMLDSNLQLRETPARTLAAIHSFHFGGTYTDLSLLGHSLEQAIQIRGTTTKRVSAIISSKRVANVGVTELAQKWQIGLAKAQQTIKATTQRGVRSIANQNLSRRFRTNDRQLRYRRLSHDIFTDTLEANVPSWHRKNKYAQVYATDFGWTAAYPMRLKSDAHETLSILAQQKGVPPRIIMDNAREQQSGIFRRKAKEMAARVIQLEPYSPWTNAAERSIKELKRGAGRKALRAHSPAALWDHCLELESLIRSHTSNDNILLQGQVPETVLTGQTADISALVEHSWYDWVKWWDVRAGFQEPKEVLGRYLGPAIDIGPAMCAKILKQNGQVIYTSTYRELNPHEKENTQEKEARQLFDTAIQARLGNPVNADDLTAIDPAIVTPEYDLYADDFEGTHAPVPDADNEVTPEAYDNYVGVEVNLPLEGLSKHAKVIRRARNADGDVIGRANSNPILDTRVYEVEFANGRVSEVTANLIAENMLSQCDLHGRQYLLLDHITDHRSDDTAVKYSDRFVNINGKQHLRKTTMGWHLCVQWKDGSTSWERLSDLKESYPVEVAEYAVAHDLEKEPAFLWWVRHVLRKRDSIISAVKKRYQKRTHKFGIRIPRTVKEALEIDRENRNTFWQDAIAKEMKNVKVAFKILEGNEPIPIGYQYMDCHIIFDVKLDGFIRKARMVAGGHMIDTPDHLTYSSVVSRETVRIALMMAALHDLEVQTSDIQNAFLTAPCAEKVWTVLGQEFGNESGKRAVIVRALYGLGSASASFSKHLADCMRHMGYEPCKADVDLWYRPETRPDDGFEYYSYILFWVDDALCIHHSARTELERLDKYFMMKPGSIGNPDMYLGAKIKKTQLENGVWAWAQSSSKYINESVNNI